MDQSGHILHRALIMNYSLDKTSALAMQALP